jgi:Protein of unknown function (DUF3179)
MPVRLTRRALTGLTAASLAALPLRAEDDGSYGLMWDVLGGSDREATAALGAIRDRGRTDLAAGLILALRFRPERAEAIQPVLQALSGAEAGDWFDWMLWQEGRPDIRPHPDYARFMRDVHLEIDPNFDAFLRLRYLAADRAKIRIEEIAWGGVVKDGIPSLDSPAMIGAGEADYLRADDLVFGIDIGGDLRAYPLRIMGWHEMFNDVIGGVPVALAYCTLCGAGILYETQVAGRRPFIFGSSGFLYRSNKLMFDRQTETLWNQFTGRPVVGPLADSGIELGRRPVVIARWDDWSGRHPGTQVLSLETGYRRDYGPGVVYRDYFGSPDLMFPALSDRRLRQKDYVFGIQAFGAAKAWPLDVFARTPVINDRVGDLAVVLIGEPDGRTVRAYERGTREFRAAGAGLRDGAGQDWEVTEAALVGPDGTELARVAGQVSYWFAWDGYLGDAAELYRP